MIKITNISKVYGPNIGNFDINMEVKKGEIYGIVGPNGAGKSTLIRQIMGFIKADQGTISFGELTQSKDIEAIMEQTGYVAGEVKMYENLTGLSFLELNASFRNNIDWDWVDKLILHFEIDTSRKIKKMSKGMKQKIALIAAVMHKPAFLILDEPTSGLDPVMQDQFDKLILKLTKDYQTTIIMCSHIFSEVAKTCDKVGFIKEGKLVEEVELKNNNIKQIETKFKKLFEKEAVL